MRYDQTIQVPVPADLKTRVQAAARQDDRTAASFARRALERYCEAVETEVHRRRQRRERKAARRNSAGDPYAVNVRSWEAEADEAQPPTVARLHSLADGARKSGASS
jgi:predicted DNA-binding protein